MSQSNLIAFIKNIFSNKNDRSLERASLPNPLVVGSIFTILFIIAIFFIVAT